MATTNVCTSKAEPTLKALQPASPAELARIDGGYPPIYVGIVRTSGDVSYFQYTGLNYDCTWPGIKYM